MNATAKQLDNTVSDPLLTCAACSRTMQAADDGTLPAHDQPGLEGAVQCIGSYSRGYPARLELKPISIELVDDAEPSQPLAAIADGVRFLNDWLGPRGMPTDQHTLMKVLAHSNSVAHAALRLMHVGQSRYMVASITRASARKAIEARRKSQQANLDILTKD
jgi:hypothetical protein